MSNLAVVSLTAVALAIAVLAQWVYHRFVSLHGLPPDLPWAGDTGTSLWSRARAIKGSFWGLRETIEHGYYKYSKHGQVHVLPNIVAGPEVILPMDQMKWLLEQPDTVLSQNEVNRQFLHADRTMLDKKVIMDTVHGNVIRREMTKELDVYAEDIVDEIEDALATIWPTSRGNNPDRTTYLDMLDVIGRISNRVLIGKDLCRNRDYHRSTCTFARGVVITAGLINLLPPFLRPILSPLILAYDMYHYQRITKYIFPIIKERSKAFKAGAKLDYRKPDYSQHNDYIQWALHDAYSHDDPAERTPEMITKRLTVLSFAGIQSSVITITNALFDIAASPDCLAIQAALRAEVLEVTNGSGAKWDRRALAKMVKIDSVFRESMRLHGFISRGVMKKVIAHNGITIPSGHHLPCGAKVGVTSYAIHHDEDAYKDASVLKPFRFCDGSFGDSKKVSMVTSADNFMAFSHGRHACPGRFFASNQLKLLLANIVLKYDIAPIAVRPQNPWLNNSIGPPIFDTLHIVERSDTTDELIVDAPVPIDATLDATVDSDSESIGSESTAATEISDGSDQGGKGKQVRIQAELLDT